MEPRVPHVTSFFTRAPFSLLCATSVALAGSLPFKIFYVGHRGHPSRFKPLGELRLSNTIVARSRKTWPPITRHSGGADNLQRDAHVTSFFARAPSSLLFCGVRNTHKYLAFAFFSRNLANAPLPPESFRTCFVCATHAHSNFCPQDWFLCHLGLY